MKIKLIKEWRHALKMLSVQLSLLGTTMSSTYAVMYDQLKESVSPQTMACLTVVVFVLSIVARVIDQGLADKE